MLEDQVAYLLQRYLGNYVKGLNKEALKISVWRGDVELSNMQLKPEALNALKLPVKVKAGFLGSVKLKVPWSRLGQDPVLVYLDRIYLLAEPSTDVEGCSEDAVQEAKRNRVLEMETKLLEKAQQLKTEVNKSWLGSLVNTIIGNLKLSISNIHIRYEDVESNPGHPFSAGVTLEKLSAVTVDDSGKEAFVTGGALDKIKKFVELEKLAFYLDADIIPWAVAGAAERLSQSDWDQVFRSSIMDGKPVDSLGRAHTYVLQPVSGSAQYTKHRHDEIINDDQALQHANLILDDVTLSLSKHGYRDIMKLADNFAAFNQRLKYAHYRPTASAKADPRSWWKYAYRANSEETKKGSGKLSWEHVLKYARLRKRYISLYASLLKADMNRIVIDDNQEIAALDREIDIDLILQWRMLAHKFVDQSVETEAAVKKQKQRKSWWSFGRNRQSSKHDDDPLPLDKDDWERLNNIIGYKETEDNMPLIHHAKGDAIHTSLEIHMRHNASKLVGESLEVLADLSCDRLDCSIRLYSEAKVFDVKLASYQLSSPSGLIAESTSSYESLAAVFSYKPIGSKLDWSMVAKASPCYITYLKEPIYQIINFFGSSTAISRTVALETVAALQMTIDEVKRTAQQQVNKALRDRSRFQLDLDIAAPKITIPSEFCPDGTHSTKLLLDLGHLVIQTQDDGISELEEDLYLNFDLVLSDVSAVLVDGDYDWTHVTQAKRAAIGNASFLPVIDKCGVMVSLQQIRIENPLYPSTRLAVRLPSLCFHFSPARYHRLMHVSKIFQEGGRSSDTVNPIQPWDHTDFDGVVPLLVWKGREAVWQQNYLCLTGCFLYILEHPGSNSYKACISLRGKQICQVSPENVGGVEHVLAVRPLGFSGKIVEDVNSVVLRCNSDDSLSIWKNRLRAAVYRASGSAAINCLSDVWSESESHSSSEDNSNTIERESLFVTGFLDELKMCFSCYRELDASFTKVLLENESHLVEFRATGGQVEVSVRSNDIFIGTLLKSLEIEDLVCCSGHRPYFLARSFIHTSNLALPFNDATVHHGISYSHNEGDDQFYEASENLVDDDIILHSSGSISGEGSRPSFPQDKLNSKLRNFSRIPHLLPSKHVTVEDNRDVFSSYQDNFVKAQIAIFDRRSHLYENIDNQIVVTLSTLSFFCRRRTVLAIVGFVNAINIEDEQPKQYIDDTASTRNASVDDDIKDLDSTVQETAVKGLLGKGKSRIIFNLIFSMTRAQVVLVKDEETTLATLSQDNLRTIIKVYPSSFSITASLGNLKVSDDSLHSEHMYFWICDMRNSEGSSFVELEFNSHCADDHDFEGYDYSLFGKLSEVQIVFLNRFVQEVIYYFTGLVPSSSTGVGKLYDNVTNTDKWLVSTEVDGSPAVKLYLSFWKPIILMPQKTESTSFLKLDVVHITVRNSFQWIYGCKDDIGAVHLEILNVDVEDINLNIGNGNELGESIIQDVNGISITVQRTLRDLLHQLPNVEASIEMLELKAALSSKEYEIITECASCNISETPNFIPPLSNDVGRQLVESVEPLAPSSDALEPSTQEVGSWLELKVSFVSNLIELRLHPGATRDTSLATVQAIGAWLVYRSDNQGDGFLSATLKSFTVTDDREGTQEEFRLAIRKPSRIGSSLSQSMGYDNDQRGAGVLALRDPQAEFAPTMLVLDARFSAQFTHVCICAQRPQLLVALDFLLAFAEFFYPTVDDMLLNDDKESSFIVTDAVILSESIYCQQSDEFAFSPEKPLVVDDERYIEFVYDGNGGTLYLLDRGGSTLISPSIEPMIYVADGKRLQFKNVVIKNGRYMDSCVLLGANSSYSASEDDHVHLESDTERPPLCTGEGSNGTQQGIAASESKNEFTLELQAIGPELTFYNTSTGVGESILLSNRLLHAEFDAFCWLVLNGDTTEMSANVLGLSAESNGVQILEPLDIFIKFSNASGQKNAHIVVSETFMNFSFDILKLFLAVEEDLMKFFRTTSKKLTESCLAFDKIGIISDPSSDRSYSFWRPRAPPGFAALGDYLTPQDKPPTKGVHSVNTTYVRLKRPVSFKLIWPISESEGDKCFVWLPVAPQGYVALGCVASHGKTPPPLSSAYCILASLVSPCALRDCITVLSKNELASEFAFWRVDNSMGTFLPAHPVTLRPTEKPYELRNIFFNSPVYFSRQFENGNHSVSSDQVTISRPEQYLGAACDRNVESVANFKLIWSNQGSSHRKKISIWRPVVPEGMMFFGDVAIEGYEPPNSCIVLGDSGEGLLGVPSDFQLVGQIKKQRDVGGISFWLPKTAPGFVSLGCIACKDAPSTSDISSLRCLRTDMVCGSEFSKESLWDTSCMNITTKPFSIWGVDNMMGTFFVRNGFKVPPRRFAFKPQSLNVPTGSDDIVIDAEVKTFSATLFDDYGGLMVPLLNLSMNGIQFNLHGRSCYFQTAVSFSLTGCGYNDKYDAWEPFLETVDGYFRYQYNIRSPAPVSQLRFTFSRDLNFNISVSNANMIFQAYASWSNLSNIHESCRIHGSTIARSDSNLNIDIHQRKSYYIVPRNNTGQDIFLRITKPEGTQQVTRMPSGDLKYFKAPVLKTMSGSHVGGRSCKMLRKLVTVIIADAELPSFDGLSSHLYAVAVRISSDRGSSSCSLPNQQSVRTCGKGPDYLTPSGSMIVTWNEMFFFKVDMLDHYIMELVITDFRKGHHVGCISKSLELIARTTDNPSDYFDFINDLVPIDFSMSSPTLNDMTNSHAKKACGRIRCSVLSSTSSEAKIHEKLSADSSNSGFFEISPSRNGPWTTMRLNYAARFTCLRFGDHVVSSEISSRDNNKYISFRSLVTVRNDTEIVLELRLELKVSAKKEAVRKDDDKWKDAETAASTLVVNELFETERYYSPGGWISCAAQLDEYASGDGILSQEISAIQLPSGWEWVDDWNVDVGSVNSADGWVYAPDIESLKWPDSYNPLKFVNYARQRRWTRTRQKVSSATDRYIPVGILNPRTTISLPLAALSQSEPYTLQVRPFNLNSIGDYSWSAVVNSRCFSDMSSENNYNSEICVSALNEAEKLLYCGPTPDISSDLTHGIWFCLSVKASVIAKDIQCNPIEDWCLTVKCPISLTNFLPMATEFSVLEMQAGGNFFSCCRGILFPGTPVNIHTGDTRNPLYLSLFPQAGWLPVHDAVLISHPKEPPSNGLNLRSSISGRMVQIILDQNQDLELPALAKAIRIYAPCWFSISRCPPFTCKLLDLSLMKKARKVSLPFGLNKKDESVLAEITHEEIYNDNTISSALNFKYLGASLSVDCFGPGEFGPIAHLSSLGNMDGQVEVKAYDAAGRCMRLCFSTKPCPFQSVPTKVVSVRPFITFTNRLGEQLYIKFSGEDERKVLNAFDARVAYVHADEEGPINIQVQLEDTEWSRPVHIVKEDTLQLVLRKGDGSRNFLRTEVRGYEEGSRFVVVFRVGSTKGPFRIENRITAFKQIRVRQSDIGNSRWTVVSPLSTINFSWEEPYGPKLVDVELNGSMSIQKFDLEKSGTYSVRKGTTEVQLHVVEIKDLHVVCFTENGMLGPISASGIRFLRLPENWETSSMMQEDDPSPVEVLIDLGVLGISFIDHKPSELCYMYLERVSVLYSTGHGRGSTSRFKLLVGYMQLDNQLTLTTMPVLLAPEQCADLQRPVFKTSVTIGNNNSDGIMVLPHIGLRVTEKLWRLNIHEPIIWAFVDFYKNLQLDILPKGSNVSQIDPEIRIDLVDISEIRLKVALETAPAQRPHGVLGVWSPVLSAVGNAFKIQVHVRKVMRKNRFMRRSTIAHSIVTRIWRDLIHNPLHLIFSLDVLGIASSTLSSLSRRFAELSTDGQFLQLRTQQVRSRRITGVGDGFIQGTEALAQSVAFGVSGVVTKPMESARQNGLLGLAHGLGKAFLGFVVQPVSGALDLVSLTVYGIGASCTRCLEVFLNRSKVNRIRNPRAIRSDCIIRDYSEEEAVGQMILHLAEAGRVIGCSDIFKEPSKFAWSDYYGNHFIVPGQRIVLITNKRVMLLQCPNLNKIDKTPSKILWDVPWGELMALELAKAGFENPSHLILHLRYFRKSESFVRIIKCKTVEASEERIPQAIRICSVIRKMWKAYESDMKCIVLKVPSNMKYVSLAGNGSNEGDRVHKKFVFKSRQLLVGPSSAIRDENIVKHCINFVKVWSSEGESKGKCALCQKQASKDGGTCSIWRVVCDEGYVIVGDIARVGCHPPNVAGVYRKVDSLFSPPVGYDLIWRNCAEDYGCPVSIWLPRPPEGFVSLGCVAVAGFLEPEEDLVYCVAETLAEEAELEEQKIWSAPNSYPWACHIYQVKSDALHFIALRQLREDLRWKVLRIKDDHAQAESSE